MEGHVIVVGVGSIHRRSCSVEVSFPTFLLVVLTYVSMDSLSCSDRIVYLTIMRCTGISWPNRS